MLSEPPKWIDDPISGPRISFSSEFLDESNFISICPNPNPKSEQNIEKSTTRAAADFEFLSSANSTTNTMITADELISEGKLLPFHQIEKKLATISVKSNTTENRDEILKNSKDESRIGWFMDDDPSPRPPKCTVLWKELLRLRKQRSSSTLSPSSSSSENEKKGIKKGLERSRSASIRIRPAVINVPICTAAQGIKSSSGGLPPLFSMRRGGRLER